MAKIRRFRPHRRPRPPQPPKSFNAEHRREWAQLIEGLSEAGILHLFRRGELVRYISAIVEHTRIHSEYERLRDVIRRVEAITQLSLLPANDRELLREIAEYWLPSAMSGLDDMTAYRRILRFTRRQRALRGLTT